MRRSLLVAGFVGGTVLFSSMAAAESWLEDFDNQELYPDLWQIKDTGLWWSPDSGDPRAEAGNGVAGTTGVSAASHNYHWRSRPFDWKDPTVKSVIIQLDYKTPAITNSDFPFSGDRLGWTTNEFGEDGAERFQVSLGKKDSTSGLCKIEGDWENAGGTGKNPLIVQYAGSLINELSFYRLKAEFTKLTVTSAKIDVTLTAVNPDGTLGSVVASGSLTDTDALPSSQIPNPALFNATTLWPSFRSYNGKAKGQTDNAYLEIVRIDAPDCFSKVTPDETVTRYAEADINEPASPSSLDYVVENLGLNAFTYTVSELNDQMQPADIAWLSTNKPGGTAAAQGSDTITALINTSGLAGGYYTAYLKFTDSCNPAVEHLRRIELAVYGCRWTVDSCSQERMYSTDYPDLLPEDVVYRIANTGDYPLNYTVAKSGDGSCFEWLTVTNPTGTVAAGAYVDVVAAIDETQFAGHNTNDDYTCTLTFSDGCSPQVVTRNVRMRYLGEGDTKVFEYNGNVDPEAENSAGSGAKFVLYENAANGSVEDDNDATDGKVWRMIDTNGSQKARYRAQYWSDSDFNWENLSVHGEAGSTMVARLKVNSWGGNDRRCWFEIADTDASSAGFHWGGLDGVVAETHRDTEDQTARGSDDFVILWITSKGDREDAEWQCGHDVDLYMLNDALEVVWEKHLPAANPETASRSGFFFGDDNTAGLMDVSYDWITGTNVGAFAPGEEVAVLGRSLIVTGQICTVPFPDADSDSDVDMADFAAFQRCYSPTMSVSEDCRCFDRNRDGSIDEDDLEAFAACAAGPGVHFDPENPPAGCNP